MKIRTGFRSSTPCTLSSGGWPVTALFPLGREQPSTQRFWTRFLKSGLRRVAKDDPGGCRIDFRFHFEGPAWRRGQPITDKEAQAGAAGLLAALGATPEHYVSSRRG